MKVNRYKLWLTCLVIVSSLCLLCCTSISSSGYRPLKVSNRICSYSLEYPAKYILDGPWIKDDSVWRYSTVDILAPKINKPMQVPDTENQEWRTYNVQYTPIGMTVWVEDLSVHRPRTSDIERPISVENIVSSNQDNQYFKIISQTNIQVDGQTAEQITYEDAPLAFITPKSSSPQIKYYRDVFFNFDGLMWHLSITADIDLKSQADVFFDHLLQTFKILN